MLNTAQLRLEEAVTYGKPPEQLSDNNLSSRIKGKCSRLPLKGEKEKHNKATDQVYLLQKHLLTHRWNLDSFTLSVNPVSKYASQFFTPWLGADCSAEFEKVYAGLERLLENQCYVAKTDLLIYLQPPPDDLVMPVHLS